MKGSVGMCTHILAKCINFRILTIYYIKIRLIQGLNLFVEKYIFEDIYLVTRVIIGFGSCLSRNDLHRSWCWDSFSKKTRAFLTSVGESVGFPALK